MTLPGSFTAVGSESETESSAGIVMGIFDNLADRHFAKDDGGRLAFLPRGPRRPAYFVDSTDADKIKSLVKIYFVASALINMIGSAAAIAITDSIAFAEHSASLAHKLKLGAVVYAISGACFTSGPRYCSGVSIAGRWTGFVLH